VNCTRRHTRSCSKAALQNQPFVLQACSDAFWPACGSRSRDTSVGPMPSGIAQGQGCARHSARLGKFLRSARWRRPLGHRVVYEASPKAGVADSKLQRAIAPMQIFQNLQQSRRRSAVVWRKTEERAARVRRGPKLRIGRGLCDRNTRA